MLYQLQAYTAICQGRSDVCQAALQHCHTEDIWSHDSERQCEACLPRTPATAGLEAEVQSTNLNLGAEGAVSGSVLVAALVLGDAHGVQVGGREQACAHGPEPCVGLRQEHACHRHRVPRLAGPGEGSPQVDH